MMKSWTGWYGRRLGLIRILEENDAHILMDGRIKSNIDAWYISRSDFSVRVQMSDGDVVKGI